MTKKFDAIMHMLYGANIWDGFRPTAASSEVQGWNGNHPSLRRLASSCAEKVVVDVGVWKGQSTITMASAIRDSGIDGCVVAVDTFLGSPEHWDKSRELFNRYAGMPDLYQTFLSNVHSAGLQDYIVPMPQTSVTAASILRRLGVKASVVHVDAAHEYEEVMRDAHEYWKILEPGGYLIGDDYHQTWPGIVRSAGEFSAATSVPLVVEPPKWILQKPIL
jgi:hypothetical protein